MCDIILPGPEEPTVDTMIKVTDDIIGTSHAYIINNCSIAPIVFKLTVSQKHTLMLLFFWSIATKSVGEGLIYLWSMGQTLSSRGKRNGAVKAEAIMTLEWIVTNTEYISMAYRDGKLTIYCTGSV